MSEVLGLEHVSLAPEGPTLTLSIRRGQVISLVGPAASGKSRLLRLLSGAERPPQGTIRQQGTVLSTQGTRFTRRQRVQSITHKRTGFRAAAIPAQILHSLKLDAFRTCLVDELSPGQIAACELIRPLSSGADCVLIDGQLDRLDPWALATTLSLILKMRSAGTSFVIATNRPDLIRTFDALIVLKAGQIRFAGTVDDLLRAGPPHELQVATENRVSVQALVSPFEVSVEEKPYGLHLKAAEGQALAARLLLEGYGDVKFVVLRPPTIEEALLSLL